MYFIELCVYLLIIQLSNLLSKFWCIFFNYVLCVARVTAALLDKINKNLTKNKIRERRAKEEIRKRYGLSVTTISVLAYCLFVNMDAQTFRGEGKVPYFSDGALP